MKTIVIQLTTGYTGCMTKIEIEVKDNETEEEIHKLALTAMLEEIEWEYWEKN